eukprot:1154202-Pelagomonas_calceolata.AAC.2
MGTQWPLGHVEHLHMPAFLSLNAWKHTNMMGMLRAHRLACKKRTCHNDTETFSERGGWSWGSKNGIRKLLVSCLSPSLPQLSSAMHTYLIHPTLCTTPRVPHPTYSTAPSATHSPHKVHLIHPTCCLRQCTELVHPITHNTHHAMPCQGTGAPKPAYDFSLIHGVPVSWIMFISAPFSCQVDPKQPLSHT